MGPPLKYPVHTSSRARQSCQDGYPRLFLFLVVVVVIFWFLSAAVVLWFFPFLVPFLLFILLLLVVVMMLLLLMLGLVVVTLSTWRGVNNSLALVVVPNTPWHNSLRRPGASRAIIQLLLHRVPSHDRNAGDRGGWHRNHRYSTRGRGMRRCV